MELLPFRTPFGTEVPSFLLRFQQSGPGCGDCDRQAPFFDISLDVERW